MTDSRRDFDTNTADAPLINGALLGAPWQADQWSDLGEQGDFDSPAVPSVDLTDAQLAEEWDDEPYDEPWYPEFPGDTRYAFCDVYEPHEPHSYRALNGNTYSCSGLSSDDLASIERLTEPRCEHGLSAYLCRGPMHW